jgi:hypothetical protein
MNSDNFNLELNEFEAFDLKMNDFSMESFAMDELNDTRYIKPPRGKERKESFLKYDHAVNLAKDLTPEFGGVNYVIVNGSFIFGDFIEAFITTHNLDVDEMVISTLSMSQNNVDSLANLLNWKFVKNLNLIVSDYFYSHERRMLVPYIYEKLDIDNRFQLSAARIHTKICMFKCANGMKFVMHGSANLRSSGNAEQFVIEENAYLYDFNHQYHSGLIEKFKTIDKNVKKKKHGNRK